jgi:hypothetical protein
MKPSRISIALHVLFLPLAPAVFAQSSDSSIQSMPSAAPSTEVPRLIKFSGTLLDERGHAVPGPAGVTFALYHQRVSVTGVFQAVNGSDVGVIQRSEKLGFAPGIVPAFACSGPARGCTPTGILSAYLAD